MAAAAGCPLLRRRPPGDRLPALRPQRLQQLPMTETHVDFTRSFSSLSDIQISPNVEFSQADFSAALTRSRVNGTRRIRTPVASKNALAIAAGITRVVGSPAPRESSSGRLILWILISSGASAASRIGYDTPVVDFDHLPVEFHFFKQRATRGLD